jgi:hypothetical protein
LNTLKYELNSVEELSENVFKINVCVWI